MSKTQKKKRHCYLCVSNVQDIDYKDVDLLRRFVSSNMKIRARRRSGLCAGCQRKAARAIKQARIAGLLPFVPR